jgi:hypothetical protein
LLMSGTVAITRMASAARSGEVLGIECQKIPPRAIMDPYRA